MALGLLLPLTFLGLSMAWPVAQKHGQQAPEARGWRGQVRSLGLGFPGFLGERYPYPPAWPVLFSSDASETFQESLQIPSNGSDPLLVAVQVFVCNVFNVDILRYTLSSVLLLRLSWLDTRLAWNASANPRRAITLAPDSLWTPGLTIRESLWVDWQNQSPWARVDPDGSVELYLALTTETNCDFELLRFPRDLSECTLSFLSMSNSVTELEFQAEAVNEIMSIKREYVVQNLKTQTSSQQLVPNFQVTLSLQNTALKTIIALLFPGEALLLADVCGGLMPLQAAERLGYKVTLLLGYLVFHSSLVQVLPSSSSCNPLLIHYFTVLLVMLFLSTIETVLLAALQARGSRGSEASPSPIPRGEQQDDENPGPSPTGKAPGRSWAEAADCIFFRIYVVGVVCAQVIFISVWMWAVCTSDPPPGKAMPHGGKPRP